MARKSDPLSDGFGTDEAEGWLGGIVADEDDLDRHALWRLGLWGFAAVGALTLGILSGQLPINAQRTQSAASDLVGPARQVEATVQENQLEARRLAAAIETLNGDRDRLFQRLSSLEQGLDVVTGSIRKADDKPVPTPWPEIATMPIIGSPPATIASLPPAPATEAPAAAPATEAPVAAPQASEPEPAPAVVATRSEPPPVDVPSTPPPVIQALPIPDAQPAPVEADTKPAEESAVALAEFGVDLGTASSIKGLRALWRGLVRAHGVELEGLHPLIALRERNNGLGHQLRLVAGPIRDAAATARICALLSDTKRSCSTTAFDGQRLSLKAEPEEKTVAPRPQKPRKSTRAPQPEPATAGGAPSLSTLLGIR